MGKGGPAGFLNKKPWHPARYQNQEEVWKREQKQAAEQKKLEELRKQYEEDRKNQEMTQIAEAAGYRKTDRLDWMYAGGLAAKEDAAKRQEEALLGQRAAPVLAGAPAAETVSRCEVASALPSVTAAATPASMNEEWNRLNNDPLLLIKRQQQEALKRVRENPIKMQEILKQVQEERKTKESGKKEKKSKKEKKEKKRKREKGSRHDSSSDSDSGDDRHRKRSQSRSPPRFAGAPHSVQASHSGRMAGYRRPAPYSGHDAGYRGGRDGRHEDDRRHDDRDKYTSDRRDRGDNGYGGRHADNADRRGDRDRGGRDQQGANGNHPPHKGSEGHRHHSNGHEAAPRDGYGLSHNVHAPEAVQRYDTSARAAETRARLEEAARRKAEEERAKAAQRGQRKEYRAGGITEEERARRLAEMTNNAEAHHMARLGRLQRAHEAEAAQGEGHGVVANTAGLGGAAREGDAFLQAASRDVYGALSKTSIGDRVGSRKHFVER